METTTYNIYTSVAQLPEGWDEVAIQNTFLQSAYLKVLETSAPKNMQCFFIGVFEKSELIGVVLAQYLNLTKLESYGERDKCVKTFIRNFVFKNFASQVLFIGNNMITGQNSFAFKHANNYQLISNTLSNCALELDTFLKSKKIKIHLISHKDFYTETALELKKIDFSNAYEFKTQPNMIFELNKSWRKNEDYISAFSKKYRDQYKRAIKKFDGISYKELTLEEIISYESEIYQLYFSVAKNAPFNTFFLNTNHFSTFKKQCENKFILVGYFLDSELVGFHTLVLNNKTLETYFLGYKEEIQKEKMLYLNMLYTMVKFGIENEFSEIIFGRTALEIKSSIGALPIEVSGFIQHKNKIINKYFHIIFPKLEPTLVWQRRHPFK